MKRLIALLVGVFLLSSPLIAEEVQLDTPYEDDPKLFIPEDYETLREHYIELAELYQEQKYDLERSVQNIDTLLQNQDRLLALNRDTRELLTDIKSDLNEPTLPDILNHGPLVGVGLTLRGGYAVHAGYQIELLNSLLLQVQLSYPPQASVLLGWEF